MFSALRIDMVCYCFLLKFLRRCLAFGLGDEGISLERQKSIAAINAEINKPEIESAKYKKNMIRLVLSLVQFL